MWPTLLLRVPVFPAQLPRCVNSTPTHSVLPSSVLQLDALVAWCPGSVVPHCSTVYHQLAEGCLCSCLCSLSIPTVPVLMYCAVHKRMPRVGGLVGHGSSLALLRVADQTSLLERHWVVVNRPMAMFVRYRLRWLDFGSRLDAANDHWQLSLGKGPLAAFTLRRTFGIYAFRRTLDRFRPLAAFSLLACCCGPLLACCCSPAEFDVVGL